MVVRNTKSEMASRKRAKSFSVSLRLTRRCIRRSIRSLMCCKGKSKYGTIFLLVARVSISSSVKLMG